MSECLSQVVKEFHGRPLTEPGELAGYAALIARYDLSIPLPARLTGIAERHRPVSSGNWLLLTPRHRSEPTIAEQLKLAFRYEADLSSCPVSTLSKS